MNQNETKCLTPVNVKKDKGQIEKSFNSLRDHIGKLNCLVLELSEKLKIVKRQVPTDTAKEMLDIKYDCPLACEISNLDEMINRMVLIISNNLDEIEL